jgi:C1A family cysteine protease
MRALLPPVRDQGSRGTCVAFAVTAAHEVARAQGEPVAEDLSEEALYWGCKVIDGDWNSGTRFTSAAAALRTTGEPLETVWPYVPGRPEGSPYGPPTSPSQLWHKSDLELASSDLVSLRAELDAGRPVLLGLVLFRNFLVPSAGGRIEVPPSGSPPLSSHAVLAVGHDPDALLVRNSWGTSWGLGGYAWLANDYAERHVHDTWTIRRSAAGAIPPTSVHAGGDIYGSL